MPKRTLNKPPTVVIIGPGRLGTALAIGLSHSGYHIQTLIGRRTSSLKKAAALLDVPIQLMAAKDIDKFRSRIWLSLRLLTMRSTVVRVSTS